MNDTPKQKEVAIKVTLLADDGLEAIYANFAEVSQSQYDTELNFARVPGKLSPEQLQEATNTGQLRVEPVVKVVMPKEVAKGLAEAIERNLKGMPDP